MKQQGSHEQRIVFIGKKSGTFLASTTGQMENIYRIGAGTAGTMDNILVGIHLEIIKANLLSDYQ